MTEAEWLACDKPGEMWYHLAGLEMERKARLCAIALCHRLHPSFLDDRTHSVLAVAYRFADNLAHEDERFATERAITQDSFPSAIVYAIAREPSVELATEAAMAFHIHSTADAATEVALIRDIFGNPFRPLTFDSAWRTDTAVSLARTMYESREFGAMPILADALQDAGCDNEDILAHCRDGNLVHVRGCWVCDLVLGKS